MPPKTQKEALGLINKPCKHTQKKQPYQRLACVFQGGGALGAFQVGAFRAIQEKGYIPNYFAGVSIGAINCAIIAGNTAKDQLTKLTTFWDTIAPKLWSDFAIRLTNQEEDVHFYNHFGAWYSLVHGLDGFFKPRIFSPHYLTDSTPDRLSYYDTSPLRETLSSLINFDLINEKKVTLCLGAVNVTSGEMEYFNNQKMEITVDHVLASGALPPGFPAIKIGEQYYWDGGIYANTPLVTVLDALPELDTLCFVVDCFSLKGAVPTNMDQIEERQKDIRYASHSRRMTNVYASRQNLQAGIAYLGEKLSAEQKQDPEVQRILALGHCKRFSVVHIIFQGTPYSHFFKDYNFARSAIAYRLHTGYKNAQKVLENPEWQHKSNQAMDCSIYGVSSDYYQQR